MLQAYEIDQNTLKSKLQARYLSSKLRKIDCKGFKMRVNIYISICVKHKIL